MANRALFESFVGRWIRRPDAVNDEAAPAYAFDPEHALAQYASTGCLNGTFYAGDAAQLEAVLELCGGVEDSFLAKAALYARSVGHMKDLPALLCAVLSVRDGALLERIFPRVVDTPRMLRTFVQIVRSGAVGRKSFGTRPRRMIRRWLETRTDDALLRASVGNAPSLADVIRMVHPKPASPSRAAFYGYLCGREVDPSLLPELARRYEAFRRDPRGGVPDLPFEMLASLPLAPEEWGRVALRLSWQSLRMNLNALARRGVFDDDGTVEAVAARLRDPREIARSRVFPYQLLVAHARADSRVPEVVRSALREALETATSNVPTIEGRVSVCVDVSGSMASPITGFRRGATSSVRCVDVAALVAATILRANPRAVVLPFDVDVVDLRLDPNDTVTTNSARLAAVGGGGTNCSAPLVRLARWGDRPDLVLLVSDNESWIDARKARATATMEAWEALRARNPRARLVCLDLQPNRTTQAYDREDILNVGGFSDGVFEVVARFARGETASGWVATIKATEV